MNHDLICVSVMDRPGWKVPHTRVQFGDGNPGDDLDHVVNLTMPTSEVPTFEVGRTYRITIEAR